eukprot:scaffold51154_cov58-Cyclotella_meneghiniana.AAC.7
MHFWTIVPRTAGSSSACDGGATSFSAGSSSLGAGGVLKLAVRGRPAAQQWINNIFLWQWSQCCLEGLH